MSFHIDQRKALLETVREASDIVAYVATFPLDHGANEPLRQVATRIDAAARASGSRELVERSRAFFNVACGIISSGRAAARLERTFADLLAAAEALADSNSSF